MAYQVVVSVDHECDLRSLRTSLEKDFTVYCNGYFDFFVFDRKVSGQESQDIAYILSYKLNEPNYDKFIDQNYVIFPCNGADRRHLMHFYERISLEFGIVFAHPRVTREGEEYLYHCLDVSSHAKILKSLNEACKFQVLSINEYQANEYYHMYVFAVHDLAKGMTKRQLDILATAYNMGYYDIPRGIRTKDIAESYNTSRYNIDKIIRTAERSIMHFIRPFLG